MKQVKHVLWFELRSILTKKSVIISTLIVSLVFLIATTIPTFIVMFGSDDPSIVDPIDEPIDQPPITSLNNAGLLFLEDVTIQDQLLEHLDDYVLYQSQQQLRSDVQSRVISEGFIIESDHSISAILLDRNMMSFGGRYLSSMLQSIQINKNLQAMELDPSTIYQAMNVEINYQETILGRDSANTFFLSFILMLAVYILVIMYGSFVSTTVAREKDNRTMEVLITSTKPSTLIIGKVFANGIAGLAQFGFVALVAMIGVLINRANFPQLLLDGIAAGFTWDGILIYLIFTVTGYLLYLFIYASLGSLVSKIEDVSSSIAPITFLFMIAYFISAFGMEFPGSSIVRVASFVPFTSILAMPVRYFQMSVAWYELAGSLALMMLVTSFFAFLSIRIYRMGSLNYGNKIGLFKAIKMIMSENKG